MANADQHDALRVDAREIGGPLPIADAVDRAAEGRAGSRNTRQPPTAAQTSSALGRPKARSPWPARASPARTESCGEKPPVWTTISPWATALTASVTIIEGMRRYATPNAVDEPERNAAADPEGNCDPAAERAPAGRRRRHHAADRDHPGHRQVDLAEQDDDHRSGRDDAEERGDLELLQEIVGDRKLRE